MLYSMFLTVVCGAAASFESSASTSAGLTLSRFDNTALRGAPEATSILSSLEAVKTCESGGCGRPHGMLITGRLAPASAGHYGFQLVSVPALPFPSSEAYARLFVDDHQLYPRNASQSSAPGNAAPVWIPLPPRALDAHGRDIAAVGASPLCSYEVRLEYVCLAATGCADRVFRVRWAAFATEPVPTASPPPGGFKPMVPPGVALIPSQGAPERARRAAAARVENGWGTFEHKSLLTWVLLPESISISLGLYQRSTGAFLPPLGLTVHKPAGQTVAAPDPPFVLRAGLHSVDQSFAEASLLWRGINVSVAVATAGATSATPSMAMTITVNGFSSPVGNASDFAVLFQANFTNGRAGSVHADAGGLFAAAAGLRQTRFALARGGGDVFRLPSPPVNASVALPTACYGVVLREEAPLALSTSPKTDHMDDVVAATAAARAAELSRLASYGQEWRDVKDAVQTSLMWSLMYDPRQTLVAPSFGYSDGAFEPSKESAMDGDTGEVTFEWDQSFVGYMLGLDALDLALGQLTSVIRARTAAGFVPSYFAGTFKIRWASQPPVSAKALAEVAKRWGVARTRWALELCFDTLYGWNTWLFTQRRETPLGLLSYGHSPYAAYAPDGTSNAAYPRGCNGESGLDNGPTVENVPCNQTGLGLQDQYSAGYSGLFLMDAEANAEIADMLGRTEVAVELRRRAQVVRDAMVATLWNASLGAFQNALSVSNGAPTPITRMSPTHFYPILGNLSEAMVAETVRRALTRPEKMAVWPTGSPPPGMPPQYARPLVQWYATVCDARGDGCVDGPHALCAQPACNYRYAYGNFVQRAHAKVRYEGIALARAPVALREADFDWVPLYEFNCTGLAGNRSDITLGREGWQPRHGAPCTRVQQDSSGRTGDGSDAVAWVLRAPTGAAAASMVELTVWYKDLGRGGGDHYVVGGGAGRTDAMARGYEQVASLGYVWPPPGTANATSRYAMPSLSKDDPLYISQDYWRGRAWAPMNMLVYWGLSRYTSPEARGATAGLVEQSKALLLREWYGYTSDNDYAGTGRRVYENLDADTGEGYSYSSSAFPMYGWGALNGFIGLVHNGFYSQVPARS